MSKTIAKVLVEFMLPDIGHPYPQEVIDEALADPQLQVSLQQIDQIIRNDVIGEDESGIKNDVKVVRNGLRQQQRSNLDQAMGDRK